MSAETMEFLRDNILRGNTKTHGDAWWAGTEAQRTRTDGEANHYEGDIPVGDVKRLLFGWEPATAPVSATVLTADGTLTVTDDSRVAIVRPDTATILGVHKSGYAVHGYSATLLDRVSNIVSDTLRVNSAGLLRGGAQAWVQVSLTGVSMVEGVTFAPFLVASTSLDGSLATSWRKGSTVVECDNTLSAFFGEGGDAVKVRHTRHSLSRMDDAASALGILAEVDDSFSAAVKSLVQTTVTDAQWEAFLAETIGAPTMGESKNAVTIRDRTRDEFSLLRKSHPAVAPYVGNAWGVVQTMNTHAHHVKSVRGGGKENATAIRALRNDEAMVTGKRDDLEAQTLSTMRRVGILAAV